MAFIADSSVAQRAWWQIEKPLDICDIEWQRDANPRVPSLKLAAMDSAGHGVIPTFLMGSSRRIQAAVFSFMAGVMPPIPMLGRSLL